MLIDINKYIGLTAQEAEEKALKEGVILRVAEEDDQKNVLTMEYRNNRINVKLKDGKITETTIG